MTIALKRGLEFTLPPELEAHEPPEARGLARDEVRLLVSAHGGEVITHHRFADLPALLRSGDLLVANDSATLPAALTAQRSGGAAITLHLSTHVHGDVWVVEPRKVEGAPGEVLSLPGSGTATLVARHAGSRRLWLARLHLPARALDYLHRWGKPISYPHVSREWPLEAYQTVYASEPGSAEMPSAGRAFTLQTLQALRAAGVRFETVTLHTGVSSLEDDEPPYPERFVVPAGTARAVHEAKASGDRVIAVGTTVVRAIETAAGERGHVHAASGWTDLVITPARGIRVVDGLLTGFHEPNSSHLMMLEAIAGARHVERAYRAAIEGGYLWHEFGDLHLILP